MLVHFFGVNSFKLWGLQLKDEILINILFSVATCPISWEKYQDSCLLLETQKKTWQDASDYCVARGGNLASIEDAAENDIAFGQFILTFVFKKIIFFSSKDSQIITFVLILNDKNTTIKLR